MIKKIKQQIKEEIIQEKFRQFLIKNDIADDYILIYTDEFNLNKDKQYGVAGTVNIYKDKYGIWNVWENVQIEYHYGYYKITSDKTKKFLTQQQAYIYAAKKRNASLSLQELSFNENNIQEILTNVKSAQNFLSIAINYYQDKTIEKLKQRYKLLNILEKEINETNSINVKKLIQ